MACGCFPTVTVLSPAYGWTHVLREEMCERITGLPLEEIERRWWKWLNGLTIDFDAFVETNAN